MLDNENRIHSCKFKKYEECMTQNNQTNRKVDKIKKQRSTALFEKTSVK